MKLAIALLIASAHALVAPSRRQHQGTALRATAPLSQQTGFSSMDTAVLDRYMSLDTGDNVQARSAGAELRRWQRAAAAPRRFAAVVGARREFLEDPRRRRSLQRLEAAVARLAAAVGRRERRFSSLGTARRGFDPRAPRSSRL